MHLSDAHVFFAVILISAGFMWAIATQSKATRAWLAGMILAIMAIIGFWIAFAGDAERISGGMPFLSEDTNSFLGKVIFGAGGALCAWLCYQAIREAIDTTPAP